LEDLAKSAVDFSNSLGSTYAEARVQKDLGNSTVIKNGEPQFSGFLREAGIGIRLIINGSLGFASTNNLTHEGIKDTILSAASMARVAATSMKKPVRLSNLKVNNTKWEVKQKYKIGSIDVENKIKFLQNLDKLFLRKKDVKFPSRLLSINENLREQIFLNSEGTCITSKVPRISFLYFMTGYKPSKGTAQRFNKKAESRGWEAVLSWDLTEFVSQEVNILASILTKAKRPPRDKIDVILGSEVTGIVCHESCGHPFEADRILGREAAEAGESFVNMKMLGKRIGSKKVNVVDDPTIPFSYGYYLYDDEGVQSSRRELIKGGIINEFLHNRETAAELGIQSNGAARTISYNREPIIRMSNTYMDKGDYDQEELFKTISRGIYIKTFMEWNIDDRRFNQRYVGLEAYFIKEGEPKYLIRNPVIEMTTPSLFKSIDAVGKDISFSAATCGKGDPQQGIPVWTGGPDIRLRNVKIGEA
jgi:TldD protein